MKFSVICFISVLALGLISMGALGGGIYYFVFPVLELWFPPLDSWRGDWVWPAMITVGMLWSFGFLIAGKVHVHLRKIVSHKFVLYAVYILILLFWDLLLWFVTLVAQPAENLIS